MAKINIPVPHRQLKEEALTRVKRLLGEVKREHAEEVTDLWEKWSGDECHFYFKVRGMTVEGKLTVHDHEVVLGGNIPLLAVPFRGKITQIVTERAKQLLA